ncbi:sugar kinase [Pontibacter sp. G13]|uniref:sugar kinase n=1 Tax=Pontibacter sp. G13 TaxID=3074898 RepID=UPI00288B1056|nr:sugar kinase [Pontibacter sp. G13]WNJ17518.1 sugar kinase [Pontibacter sp. G13]
MSIEYAIVVKQPTQLEQLLTRFHTRAQAAFYLERQGLDIQEAVEAHDTYHAALSSLQHNLDTFLKHKLLDREFLPNFQFASNQVILVLGQDGLVANTAKYALGRPIIGINPDPTRFDGPLLPFRVANTHRVVEAVISGQASMKRTQFAEAILQHGQRLLAFNDLFIGAESHVSARYRLNYHGQVEDHSSSGIIVSTEMGQTGWMSSMFNMIQSGNRWLGQTQEREIQPSIGRGELLFAVREPFRSQRTGISMTMGQIQGEVELRIESQMAQGGVIFSDGIQQDRLSFNRGDVATIRVADEGANLVVA